MKTTFLTGFLLMCACTLAAQSQPNTKTISVEVTNSWSKDKSDAPVVLKIKDLQPGFRVRSAVVMNGSEEIPSQLDDLNGDLKADELAFVMDIPARSKKTLAVTLSSAQTDKTYPARVFAEMLIRDAKKQKHAPTQSVTVPGTTNFIICYTGTDRCSNRNWWPTAFISIKNKPLTRMASSKKDWKSRKAVSIPMTNSLHADSETMY